MLSSGILCHVALIRPCRSIRFSNVEDLTLFRPVFFNKGYAKHLIGYVKLKGKKLYKRAVEDITLSRQVIFNLGYMKVS
jgi:hypothetical protein